MRKLDVFQPLMSVSLGAVCLVGLLARLSLMLSREYFLSYDLHSWFWAGWVLNVNPNWVDYYSWSKGYPYPPLWPLICAIAYRLHPYYRMTSSFVMLIKTPLVLADLVTAVLIYLLIDDRRMGLVGATLYALNIHVAFVSGVWGMFDGLAALFLILSLYLIKQDNYTLAGLACGLALLTKQHAIPVVIALTTWMFMRRRDAFGVFILASAGLFTAVSAPFFLAQPEYFTSKVIYDTPTGSPMRRLVGSFWWLLRLVLLETGNAWRAETLNTWYFWLFYISLFAVPLLTIVKPLPVSRVALLSILTFYVFTPYLSSQHLVVYVSFLCLEIAMKRHSPLWYGVTVFCTPAFSCQVKPRVGLFKLQEMPYMAAFHSAILFLFLAIWLATIKAGERDDSICYTLNSLVNSLFKQNTLVKVRKNKKISRNIVKIIFNHQLPDKNPRLEICRRWAVSVLR